MSGQEVERIIMQSLAKQCKLDPLPTPLVKDCFKELAPIITEIVNLSLVQSGFPNQYKRAIVKPLLKKARIKYYFQKL